MLILAEKCLAVGCGFSIGDLHQRPQGKAEGEATEDISSTDGPFIQVMPLISRRINTVSL